jgi:hypothetical protein
MLDGYWLYGRRDFNNADQSTNWTGTSDDLYVYGGHVGASPLDGTGSAFHYHVTAWTACYDETFGNGGATHASDDGAATCTQSSGKSVTAYFLTGHGNGGVFKQVPSGVTTSTPAVRYLYGSAGSCSGC